MIYYCAICLVLTFYSFVRIQSAKSGPYVITLTRVQKCEVPSRPYETLPSADFYGELYKKHGTVYLRGNATILGETKNMRLTLIAYFLERGSWHVIMKIPNVGCHNRVVWLLLKGFNLPMNKRNCFIPKGVYAFKDLDYNVVDHIWASTREYGVLKWRLEVKSNNRTVICWESETEVTPAPA